MNDRTLDPDALAAAASALTDIVPGVHPPYSYLSPGDEKKHWEGRAAHIVSAYLDALTVEDYVPEDLGILPTKLGSVIQALSSTYVLCDPDDTVQWRSNRGSWASSEHLQEADWTLVE